MGWQLRSVSAMHPGRSASVPPGDTPVALRRTALSPSNTQMLEERRWISSS